MLPRHLVLPVSRPANQRPVAPRLLLLTLHFCRPPPPAPRAAAKRRVVSRRFWFRPRLAPTRRPPTSACSTIQHQHPKPGSLSGSSLLAFVFFFLSLSKRPVSINCRHIHPVHSLSRHPALVADCRAVDQHHLLYGISQTRPIQRPSPLSQPLAQLGRLIFLCAHSSIREKPALVSSYRQAGRQTDRQTLTHPALHHRLFSS